jgi:NRAMP (natural resistance-associated macrophage protein)-like metal ion transporter
MWFTRSKKLTKLKALLNHSTTGLITGAAGNDPTGIATYAVIGATFGYSLLWLLILCFPLLLFNMGLAAKMAQVTKRGFLGSVKKHLGKTPALILLFTLWIANLGTIGAAFSGTGQALNMIIPFINPKFLSLITALIFIFLITSGSYQVVKKFFILLSLMLLAYVFAGFLAKPDWSQVVSNSFIPQLSSHPMFWIAAVGLLGTTISPHMYFWQVAEEVEEHPSINKIAHQIRDLSLGSFLSILVAAFIVIASAATLHANQLQVVTAVDAAQALAPVAGDYSALLFAIGLISAGFLAIPVLAIVLAYSTSEEWDWPEGLNLSPHDGEQFYSAFAWAILLGVLISLLNIPPIKLLFWSQVLNGFVLPFVIICLLIITNRQSVMKRFQATVIENFAVFLTLALSVAAIALSLLG